MSAVYELPAKAFSESMPVAVSPLGETLKSPLEVHRSAVQQASLQIELLLDSIESATIRKAVQPVLGDLLRLLDCLHLFESHLSQIDQAAETLAMFELVHAEARLVVHSIRSLTTQPSDQDESLMETLDGIAFAIAHDLHRVFDCQLSDLTFQPPSPPQLVIGELIHSHGLLKNCVQESIRSLVQEFDPTMTRASLFEDSNARLTESLLLCRELTELIEFVREWKDLPGGLSVTSVVERVMAFRRGSMRFLMYRDWQEYERFSARIILASSERRAMSAILDAFACYLETLLRLVSSRSVLSEAAVQDLSSEDLSIPAAEEPRDFSAVSAQGPEKSSLGGLTHRDAQVTRFAGSAFLNSV